MSEALFMTIITISTVGYGETNTLTEQGRLFTGLLIFLSIGSMTFFTASLTSLIVKCDLNGWFVSRRMIAMAQQVHNHTIICGSDAMAQIIIDQLLKLGKPIVVIGNNATELEEIKSRFPSVPVIEGCPKSELALADANVLYADNIVTTMEQELDNLLISITCKDLRKDIKVIARSDDPKTASRLTKAGIDHVICPVQLSGLAAVQLLAN